MKLPYHLSEELLSRELLPQLLVLLPAAYLLSLSGRLELVWLAPLTGELLTMFVAVFLNRKVKTALNAEMAHLPEASEA